MYEYQRNTDLPDFNVNISTQDWHFPKKYFKSVGYTVDGFKFLFPKVKTAISDILNPTKKSTKYREWTRRGIKWL